MTLQLAHQNATRRNLLAIMQAALDAVEPLAAVKRALRREDDLLLVGERRYNLMEFERVWVVGAGKAAAPMAQAVEALLGERLTGGTVVVKYDHLAAVKRVELREAAHPIPDEAALHAGSEVLRLAEQATERDLVICLLSGGGSALLEALPDPLTLADLQRTTELLLASGASINEINVVRKHLSLVKGGQFARTVAPATLVTLILSDVVGSPLDVIASGPTVPDRSTWSEVAEVVDHYGIGAQLPSVVRERIERGAAGQLPDTPKPRDPAFDRVQVLLVGDNAQAAQAAWQAATRQGYQSLILTTFLEGEAREVAKVMAALGREMVEHQRPLAPPACLILGGETTVTLQPTGEQGRDTGTTGKGGRNQELALAAALALEGGGGITVGALATDGSDGPTDSAGAMVDGESMARAREQDFDPVQQLARHDAYPLLDTIGDLLRSGPTNTNVNDLLFVIAEPT